MTTNPEAHSNIFRRSVAANAYVRFAVGFRFTLLWIRTIRVCYNLVWLYMFQYHILLHVLQQNSSKRSQFEDKIVPHTVLKVFSTSTCFCSPKTITYIPTGLFPLCLHFPHIQVRDLVTIQSSDYSLVRVTGKSPENYVYTRQLSKLYNTRITY